MWFSNPLELVSFDIMPEKHDTSSDVINKITRMVLIIILVMAIYSYSYKQMGYVVLFGLVIILLIYIINKKENFSQLPLKMEHYNESIPTQDISVYSQNEYYTSSPQTMQHHTQAPMYGQNMQQPMYGQHTQQPMYGKHTQQPMYGQHRQQPMYGQHLAQSHYPPSVYDQPYTQHPSSGYPQSQPIQIATGVWRIGECGFLVGEFPACQRPR